MSISSVIWSARQMPPKQQTYLAHMHTNHHHHHHQKNKLNFWKTTMKGEETKRHVCNFIRKILIGVCVHYSWGIHGSEAFNSPRRTHTHTHIIENTYSRIRWSPPLERLHLSLLRPPASMHLSLTHSVVPLFDSSVSLLADAYTNTPTSAQRHTHIHSSHFAIVYNVPYCEDSHSIPSFISLCVCVCVLVSLSFLLMPYGNHQKYHRVGYIRTRRCLIPPPHHKNQTISLKIFRLASRIKAPTRWISIKSRFCAVQSSSFTRTHTHDKADIKSTERKSQRATKINSRFSIT